MLQQDARLGVRWGLTFATVYIAWASVLYLITGGRAFAEMGVTYTAIITIYFVGGAFAGAIVGVLRRFARNRFLAAGVGVCAAIPVSIGFRVMDKGIMHWTSEDTITLVVFSLIIGGVTGMIFYGIFVERN